jgi:hypothetical protein
MEETIHLFKIASFVKKNPQEIYSHPGSVGTYPNQDHLTPLKGVKLESGKRLLQDRGEGDEKDGWLACFPSSVSPLANNAADSRRVLWRYRTLSIGKRAYGYHNLIAEIPNLPL